jgi:hypothetical protein
MVVRPKWATLRMLENAPRTPSPASPTHQEGGGTLSLNAVDIAATLDGYST